MKVSIEGNVFGQKAEEVLSIRVVVASSLLPLRVGKRGRETVRIAAKNTEKSLLDSKKTFVFFFYVDCTV